MKWTEEQLAWAKARKPKLWYLWYPGKGRYIARLKFPNKLPKGASSVKPAMTRLDWIEFDKLWPPRKQRRKGSRKSQRKD